MNSPTCPFCQHSLYAHNSTRCREKLPPSMTDALGPAAFCRCRNGVQYIQGLLLLDEAEFRLNRAFDTAINNLARRFNK